MINAITEEQNVLSLQARAGKKVIFEECLRR